jgi:DNA polymerase I-like protein with 3'-5' exonuclease and polymerase domains
MLRWIGRSREEVFISYVTACLPKDGATDAERMAAARACKGRLLREIAKFPAKPALLLGSVVARSVIPADLLTAIDPPEADPAFKRRQKDRQEAEKREAARRAKRLERLYERAMRKVLRANFGKARFDLLDEASDEQRASLESEAREMAQQAAIEFDKEARDKRIARRLTKKKSVSISDIASTHFSASIDGTGPRSLIPTIHPGIMLAGGKTLGGTHSPDLAFWNLVADAGKVDALAAGRNLVLSFDVTTEYESSERADALFKQIYHEVLVEKSFALDLETYVEDPDRHHALQAFVAQVRAVGISTRKTGISVLWDLLSPASKTMLRSLLVSEEIVKVYHNGLYDRTVLAARGFPSRGPWEDTLLLHHATFPGAPHKLQSVTAQFKAVDPWKSEFRNQEETPERLTLYCAKDTQSTAIIEQPLQAWVKKTGVEKLYALDKKMSECASRMHLDGVPMSRDVNNALFTQFSGVIAAAKETVLKLADAPETRQQIWALLAHEQAKKQRKTDPASHRERVALRLAAIEKEFASGKWAWKISSTAHIAALLRAIGVELAAVTESGATKVDKETLEALVEVEVVRDILRFRENDKRLMTFIWPIFDRRLRNGSLARGFADEHNRVHPIWSIHKISGRWASTEPVCSNYPKAKIKKHPDGRKEVLVPDLRAQVVAPEGRTFVGFDFGQLEARIIAMVSGDEWLCKVFADGKDIHTEAARLIWGAATFDALDPDSRKKIRDQAKPFEYGAFYGADPETLYRNLVKQGTLLRREDVYKAHSTLMRGMPGVAAYQSAIVAKAAKPPHEIRSFLYGRRRCFPLGEPDRNECLNFPIQSSAADIMNTGMERMMGRLGNYRQAFPILQIHDAAVFEVWEDDAEEFAADVVACFTQEYEVNGVRVPFPIECKIGSSWAKL